MNSDVIYIESEILAAFGKNLALLRKRKGWSQEKLALESGIARSYLSGVERGPVSYTHLDVYKRQIV